MRGVSKLNTPDILGQGDATFWKIPKKLTKICSPLQNLIFLEKKEVYREFLSKTLFTLSHLKTSNNCDCYISESLCCKVTLVIYNSLPTLSVIFKCTQGLYCKYTHKILLPYTFSKIFLASRKVSSFRGNVRTVTFVGLILVRIIERGNLFPLFRNEGL